MRIAELLNVQRSVEVVMVVVPRARRVCAHPDPVLAPVSPCPDKACWWSSGRQAGTTLSPPLRRLVSVRSLAHCGSVAAVGGAARACRPPAPRSEQATRSRRAAVRGTELRPTRAAVNSARARDPTRSPNRNVA
eukprot:ctg_672.g368